MKKLRLFVFIFLLSVAVPFALHRRASTQSPGTITSQAPDLQLQIISPRSGETLSHSYVTVQYGSSKVRGGNSYNLYLDGREPVQTIDTTYTFNGVQAGEHHLAVETAGRGAPVSRSRSEIKFTVANPAHGGNSTVAQNRGALPLPPASDLPDGNSSLPLLSVIGFGILVGGVISALRTRSAPK